MLAAVTAVVGFSWGLFPLMLLLVAVIAVKAFSVLVTESPRRPAAPRLVQVVVIPAPRPVSAPAPSIALPV